MSTSGGIGNANGVQLLPSGDTTGATDTAAIKAAVNSFANAYPNQGGRLVLAAGVFFVNAPIAITSDNVTIEGAGQGDPVGATSGSNPAFGGTVIRATAGFSGSFMLAFGLGGSPARTITGCFMRNVGLDGFNLPGTTGGIFWQVFKGGGEHVYVARMTGNGIVIDGNGSYAFPNGAWDNHFYDWTVDSSAGTNWVLQNDATDNEFTSCTSKYAGTPTSSTPGTATSHGWSIDSGSSANRWVGGYTYSCGGKAFNCANGWQLKWSAHRLQDVNGGIYVAAAAGTGGLVIAGCTFRNCSAAADNTTDCINLTSSGTIRGAAISGNDFDADQGNTNLGTAPNMNRARYGINIGANWNGTVVAPNDQGYNAAYCSSAFGTGYITDLGANTLISGIGPSGNLELWYAGGSQRFVFRSGDPNSAASAGVGSVVARPDGGHGTSFYLKESGSGNTGWVPIGSRLLRKVAVAAVPSATANTNGPTQTINPSSDYFSFVCQQLRLVTTGTFVAETVTANVTFNFSDSTTQTFSTTFTSDTTYDLTGGNLNVNAVKDGVFLTSVSVNCQSTINNSAVTVTATFTGVNG